MDIKEIAPKVAMDTGLYLDGANQSEPLYVVKPEEIVEFAEALISAYKAELLKEVGEPVLYAEFAEDGGWLGATSEYQDHLEEPHALYTSDQVAASVLKATKSLEERRCEICGYAEHHREHTGCLRTQLAAAQEETRLLTERNATNEEYAANLVKALTKTQDQLAKAEQRYLAWEGGEEWEQLAFQLCADECGEESCNELIWEGCPPEPWGERWLKYESEAKRIIQLVRQYAPDKKAEQRVAEWVSVETQLPGEQGFDSEEVLCFLNGHCSITDF